MKIRFIFDPLEVNIPNSELFDYLQDVYGSFDGLELKDVSEEKLFKVLSEIDLSEFHADFGFDFPDAVSVELVK